jgi:hypothetical protein
VVVGGHKALLEKRACWVIGFGCGLVGRLQGSPPPSRRRGGADQWWGWFGNQIETNWEIERIRLYSSRDPAGLRELMVEPKWSNEGLFAFSEGLRRLVALDTSQRVAAPAIEVGE